MEQNSLYETVEGEVELMKVIFLSIVKILIIIICILYMEASELKWVNPVLNNIGVNSFNVPIWS